MLFTPRNESCQAKRLCGTDQSWTGSGSWGAGVAHCRGWPRIQLRRDVLSWLRVLALKLQFDFCFCFCFCCFCSFWFCFCFGCCCFFVAFTVAVAASCCTLFIQSPQLTPSSPAGQLINNSDCAPVYNADPAVVVAATARPRPVGSLNFDSPSINAKSPLATPISLAVRLLL